MTDEKTLDVADPLPVVVSDTKEDKQTPLAASDVRDQDYGSMESLRDLLMYHSRWFTKLTNKTIGKRPEYLYCFNHSVPDEAIRSSETMWMELHRHEFLPIEIQLGRKNGSFQARSFVTGFIPKSLLDSVKYAFDLQSKFLMFDNVHANGLGLPLTMNFQGARRIQRVFPSLDMYNTTVEYFEGLNPNLLALMEAEWTLVHFLDLKWNRTSDLFEFILKTLKDLKQTQSKYAACLLEESNSIKKDDLCRKIQTLNPNYLWEKLQTTSASDLEIIYKDEQRKKERSSSQ